MSKLLPGLSFDQARWWCLAGFLPNYYTLRFSINACKLHYKKKLNLDIHLTFFYLFKNYYWMWIYGFFYRKNNIHKLLCNFYVIIVINCYYFSENIGIEINLYITGFSKFWETKLCTWQHVLYVIMFKMRIVWRCECQFVTWALYNLVKVSRAKLNEAKILYTI